MEILTFSEGGSAVKIGISRCQVSVPASVRWVPLSNIMADRLVIGWELLDKAC